MPPVKGPGTLAGTGNAALLLERVIGGPPNGGYPLRVMASMAVEPPVREAGVTATDVKVGNTTGVRVTPAVLLPPL
jgi:hypothetical protein